MKDFLKNLLKKIGIPSFVGACVGFGAALMSVQSGWEALVGIGTVATAATVGVLTGYGAKIATEFGLRLAPRVMERFREFRDRLFHRNRGHMKEDLQKRQVQTRSAVPQASVMPERKPVQKQTENTQQPALHNANVDRE